MHIIISPSPPPSSPSLPSLSPLYVQALMFIIWIIIEVLFLFLFYELPTVIENDSTTKPQSPHHKTTPHSEHLPSGPSANIQQATIPGDSMSDYAKTANGLLVGSQSTTVEVQNGGDGTSEQSPLLSRFSVNKTTLYNTNSKNQTEEAVASESQVHVHPSCWQRLKKTGGHFVWSVSELLREEMVVLLAILFITMFSQTTTEVLG